jgi:hypothetical protein
MEASRGREQCWAHFGMICRQTTAIGIFRAEDGCGMAALAGRCEAQMGASM